MRKKILNALVILTSLFGYLEWGGGNGAFLFQAEWEVLRKLFSDPVSAAHPFTLVPLLGQVLLLITLFQKEPSRWVTYIGIACLALLLLMMVLVGVLGSNFKILLSTLPFMVTAVLAIREARKK
ncbi:MAG: hypothetical protein IPM25_03175 [Chloracidobacterium sp.]|nr:hypothetical protein [Chloracidobacterium sp.]